jgi:ADP-ribosylglycohydrolase
MHQFHDKLLKPSWAFGGDMPWGGVPFQVSARGENDARHPPIALDDNGIVPAPVQGSTVMKNRVLGCLFGGALGDAWGGPYEGAAGPVVFEIPPRPALSDDTQLTLATCQSIVEFGGVNPENLASQFLRWFRERRIRGIGSSTLKAMRDLAAGTHWALAGARGEYAGGNGAAMRVAPLAFLLNPESPPDRTLIRDVCRITHHNDEACAGALAVILAIRSVISGAWSPARSFLAATIDGLPDSAVRDRMAALLPLDLPPSEVARAFGATGHVVDTVPLALYCAQSIAAQPLVTVLAQTIRVGGDADTIASIAGQVAGTVAGLAGIPQNLLAEVTGIDELQAIAREFAAWVADRDPQAISS